MLVRATALCTRYHTSLGIQRSDHLTSTRYAILPRSETIHYEATEGSELKFNLQSQCFSLYPIFLSRMVGY